MRKRPENQREKILPTHDAHGPGWNESSPELVVDCTDPGHFAPCPIRKTTTDDARSKSVQSVQSVSVSASISVSVSPEYTVQTSQSKPSIEPFFALLHHPPKLLIPATKPWQPTHPFVGRY